MVSGHLSPSRLAGRSPLQRLGASLAVAWPALVAGVVSLALYVPTLLPDIGFWDTAEFQAIGPVLGIAHPTGYPAYTLLAWLASVLLQPLGTEAFRANLLSALLMASAAGLLAVAVTLLTRRRVLGLAAGLLLGSAPTVWSNAVRADAHALHLALVALLLVVLLVWAARQRAGDARAGRWLVASAVIYGVALGNHALTLLLAPDWIFALGYQNAGIERYYLVPLLVAVIFAALLAAAVLDLVERATARSPQRSRRSGALHGAFGSLALMVLLAPALIALPATRQGADASDERDARIWLEAAFQALGPDAVIISWWSYSTPLWYGQFVEGRRGDVLVLDDRTIIDQGLVDVSGAIDRYLGERPVYLIRLPREVEAVAAEHALEPVPGVPGGDIWRVLPPEVVYDRPVSSQPGAVTAGPAQP